MTTRYSTESPRDPLTNYQSVIGGGLTGRQRIGSALFPRVADGGKIEMIELCLNIFGDYC